MGKLSEMTALTACTASIDFDSALAVLSALAKPRDPVAVSISDAGGCHLAAPVHALLDSPRHACAAMDGYAVRDCDLSTGAATFRSIGVNYAGSHDAGEIGPVHTIAPNFASAVASSSSSPSKTSATKACNSNRVASASGRPRA